MPDEATAAYLTPGPVHRRLGLVCLGAGTAPHDRSRVDDRALSCHAAVFVGEGRGDLVDERTGRHAVSGPVLFWLRPGVRHSYGPGARGWAQAWVLFDGPAVRAYTDLGYLPSAADPPVTPLTDPTPVARAFARVREAVTHAVDPDVPAAAAVADLLVTVRRYGPEPAEDRVLAELRATATDRVGIAERARRLAVSERTLRDSVRRATGVGPAAYLVGVRLNLAKDLLAGTELGVAAVARRVGYDDAGYFSRLFTRRTGTSPSAFREQQRRDRF